MDPGDFVKRGRVYLAEGAWEVAAAFFAAAGADELLTSARVTFAASHGGCDVVVLAGGQSRRWGAGNKLDAMLRGHALLDWATIGAAISPNPIIVGTEHGGGPLAAIGAAIDRLSAPMTWVVAGDQPLIVGAAATARASLAASSAEIAAVVAASDPGEADGPNNTDQSGQLVLPGPSAQPDRFSQSGQFAQSGQSARPGRRRNTTGVIWRTDLLRGQLDRLRRNGPLTHRSAQELFGDCQLTEVTVPSRFTMDCDSPDDHRLIEALLNHADLAKYPIPHPYA